MLFVNIGWSFSLPSFGLPCVFTLFRMQSFKMEEVISYENRSRYAVYPTTSVPPGLHTLTRLVARTIDNSALKAKSGLPSNGVLDRGTSQP